MSAVNYYRFPCDQAYTRGTHLPDEAGDVLHSVSWKRELDATSEDLRRLWQVRTIAWGSDGPWHVQVIVGKESFQFWKLDDARRMIDGLMSAVLCAAEAAVEEAGAG